MKTEPTSLRPNLSVEIGPSIYDRVSAAVVSGILLFGFMLLVLLAIWWRPATDRSTDIGDLDPLEPNSKMRLELEESKDFLEPGVQEFPEVAVPQLAQVLTAASAAVSSVQGSPEFGIGSKSKSGPGKPTRGPSPDLEPSQTPAHKRWSIKFQADDIDMYAKQLSFFNIDVAAIHQSRNSIWRVNDVAGANTVVLTSRQQEDRTLRFQHRKPFMQRWDRELCERAGVKVDNTIQSHFYPASTQRELEKVESIAVAQSKRQLKDVRKTTFKIIEKKDEGFSFEVAEILYH